MERRHSPRRPPANSEQTVSVDESRVIFRPPATAHQRVGELARAEPRRHSVLPVRVAGNGLLVGLWYDGWQDAHARILPPALARLRTRESLENRLRAALPSVRVMGQHGAPVGFCMVKGDELYQLFVAGESRGSGVAAALLADAEARLSADGVEVALLACAIGNDRAARFYEKHGWHRVGTVVNPLDTSSGTFPLEVWRYEKRLAG